MNIVYRKDLERILSTAELDGNFEQLEAAILLLQAATEGTLFEYASTAEAMAVTPLPANNIPFIVRGSTNGAEDGHYIYDSNEADGYKPKGGFEVPGLNAGTLNPTSTTTTPAEKTVADFVESKRGGKVAEGETKDVSGGEVYDEVSPINAKLDVLEYTRINLADESAIESGYVDSSGDEVAWSGASRTPFIEIEGGKTYFCNKAFYAGATRNCWYDENKVFIGANLNTGIIATPLNAKFIRYSVNNDFVGITVNEGTSAVIPYVPYNYFETPLIDIIASKQDIDNIPVIETEVYEDGYINNIFSVDGFLEKSFFEYANGNRATVISDIFDSVLIPVREGNFYYNNNCYKIGGTAGFCWFTENMVYISGEITSGEFIGIAPKGAKFLGLTLLPNFVNPIISENSTVNLYTENYEIGEDLKSVMHYNKSIIDRKLPIDKLTSLQSGRKNIAIIGTSISAYPVADALTNKRLKSYYEEAYPGLNLLTSISTWGIQYLQKFLLANTVMYNQVTDAISEVGNTSLYATDKAFNGFGTAIYGLGAKLKFSLKGSEVNLCHIRKVTSDYGIMQITINGEIWSTFDNRNDGTLEIGYVVEDDVVSKYRASNNDAFEKYTVFPYDNQNDIDVEIEIIGGVNPYFIFDIATTKLHGLTNGAAGGRNSTDFVNTTQATYTGQSTCELPIEIIGFQHKPDILFIEHAANDAGIWGQYQSMTISNMNEWNCTIDSATMPEVGDIVFLNVYRGDYFDIIQRIVSWVDIPNKKIAWSDIVPLSKVHNVNTWIDFPTQAYFKNLNSVKPQWNEIVRRVHAINPLCKVVLTSARLPLWNYTTPTSQSNNGYWGLELFHKQFAAENNNWFDCCIETDTYNFLRSGLTGKTKIDLIADGSSEYSVSTQLTSLGRIGQEYCSKILVDGVDITHKDAYFDSANKKIVFYRNTPTTESIKVVLSDFRWSYDGLHPRYNGEFIYGKKVMEKVIELC